MAELWPLCGDEGLRTDPYLHPGRGGGLGGIPYPRHADYGYGYDYTNVGICT